MKQIHRHICVWRLSRWLNKDNNQSACMVLFFFFSPFSSFLYIYAYRVPEAETKKNMFSHCRFILLSGKRAVMIISSHFTFGNFFFTWISRRMSQEKRLRVLFGSFLNFDLHSVSTTFLEKCLTFKLWSGLSIDKLDAS